MITINQYIKLFTDFFEQHRQINTILTGDDFNFNADSEVVYPVSHIEYVTQSISDQFIQHQFEIIIGDLFDPNINNAEVEIYNDCNLIAADFIDYFANQYDEDYEINEQVSLNKFTDSNVDRVAGVVFVVTFQQFREANDCIIPIETNIDTLPLIYYGPVASIPTFNDLSTLNVSSELVNTNMNTGLNKLFVIAVKNGYLLNSVTDISASDLDLTSSYKFNSSVTDGSTIYNLYVLSQAISYSSNHVHQISIIPQ